MKRLILVCAAVFVMFGSAAFASEEGPGSSIFQVIAGPSFDVHNWGANQFTAGIAVGGKYFRFGLGYNRSTFSALGVSETMNAFRPSLIIDVPFTFNVGSQSQLALGPIIDLGPSFGFMAGEKIIDFMVLGFGLDAKFYFTDSFGISLTPVHLSTSFATWGSGGGGVIKKLRMSYDLLFSLLLRW